VAAVALFRLKRGALRLLGITAAAALLLRLVDVF
jgi:hypothetical protein